MDLAHESTSTPLTPASSGLSLASTSLTASSSRFLSPNTWDDPKRKMQTTVAILEPNPHKFKIMPLKQVPSAQRRDFAHSPSLNFERPYVGWRPEPPSLYQLAPSRSASSYSGTNLHENTSQTSPQPSPSRRTDAPSVVHASRHRAGLGLSFRSDSSDLSLRARRTSTGSTLDRPFEERERAGASWRESTSDPDLTFSTTGELSRTPSLDTPVLPSVSRSSDSLRLDKAHSVHIARAADADLPLHDADAPLRRARSKTLSEAALANASVKGRGRLHKQRRHAIYAGAGMHIAFSPPEAGNAFPVAVIVTPDGEADAAKRDDAGKRSGLSISESKASLNSSPRRALHDLDTNARAGTHLDPWSTPSPSKRLLSVPSGSPPLLSVARLKIAKKYSPARHGSSTQNETRPPRSGILKQPKAHHPIISALLHDVDQALKDWQYVGRI